MKPMTVRDLITKLLQPPASAIVLSSRDSEGNGFSPVFEIATGQCTQGPYGFDLAITEDDREEFTKLGFSDEDFDNIATKGVTIPCVVIWPSN